MLSWALTLIQVILSGVFATASVGKLLHTEQFASALRIAYAATAGAALGVTREFLTIMLFLKGNEADQVMNSLVSWRGALQRGNVLVVLLGGMSILICLAL